jgi:toxin ParE1/3/4
MKLVYSRRALADLEEIATYYTDYASPAIAETIGRGIESAIARIGHFPKAAPKVSQRSKVRAATVLRYPFRIFYRVQEDTINILHVRHTSRRPSGYVE